MFKLQMGIGVTALLANSHTEVSLGGTRHYFRGDCCQRSAAQCVADCLEIPTYIEKGIPFVTSKGEFETIKNYLIENQINGWWHYTTN